MRRSLALAFTVILLGCDPAAGVSARVTLAPAPEQSCVDSVLAASPLVDSVHASRPSRDDQRSGRRFFQIRFEPDSGVDFPGSLRITQHPDSVARIEVAFIWMGTLEAFSPAERAAMGRLGRALLQNVSDACARPASTGVICQQSGWGVKGRRRSCEAAT